MRAHELELYLEGIDDMNLFPEFNLKQTVKSAFNRCVNWMTPKWPEDGERAYQQLEYRDRWTSNWHLTDEFPTDPRCWYHYGLGRF